MAAGDTHYEIHFRPTPRHAWQMLGVESVKDTALNEAREALAEAPEASVKVTKEVFDEESGTFVSNVVFRQGDQTSINNDRAHKRDNLPCAGPHDLTAVAGRDMVRRAVRNWLRQEGVLVLELLHNPQLVERLEATGTVMQHAVQKFAVARAEERNASVQHYIKQLNDLVQQSTELLFRETRLDPPEPLTPDTLAKSLETIANHNDRARRLRFKIARTLEDQDTWAGKGGALLTLLDAAREIGEDADWAIKALEEFLDEFVIDEDARASLMTPGEDFGAIIESLTALLCGKSDAQDLLSPLGCELARQMKQQRFKRAQLIIAREVLRLLQTPKRLRPKDVFAEIALVRKLADSLIYAASRLVSIDDITAAFVIRSAQLVQADAMAAISDARPEPEEALNALMDMEKSVIGIQNKVKIADYIIGFATAHQAKNHFVFGDQPLVARLSALGRLDKRLHKSTFPETEVIRISKTITAIAQEIDRESQFFRKIDGAKAGAFDRALEHLKLIERNILPRGEMWTEACRRARRLMASPSAREDLAKGGAAAVEKAERVKALLRKFDSRPSPNRNATPGP